MKTVIAIPYREADERRRELLDFTLSWLARNHWDWDIFIGDSPDGPFNRGAAINDAVRRAGDDWDVVIATDGDNISHPAMLGAAAEEAHTTGVVTHPFETYVYLDQYSSEQFLGGTDGLPVFVAPELHPSQVFRTTVRHHHYSGIQAIPRAAWNAVGGFIELPGWGAEDAIMNTVFKVFANDSGWLRGGAYHLWHPAKRNDPKDACNVRNHQIWSKVNQIMRRPDKANQLRRYLRAVGYEIP